MKSDEIFENPHETLPLKIKLKQEKTLHRNHEKSLWSKNSDFRLIKSQIIWIYSFSS